MPPQCYGNTGRPPRSYQMRGRCRVLGLLHLEIVGASNPHCKSDDAPLPSAGMKITVNGEAHEASPDATVRTLLESLDLGDTLVAVEKNRKIVPRASHSTTKIAPGDVIEIVHFVGGG